MMMIRTTLENDAVSKLRKFGFIMADNTNIYYHDVYGAYFLDILRKKKGTVPLIDEVIDEMIIEIGKQQQKYA